MSTTQNIGVRIGSERDKRVSEGEIRVQFWDKRERTFRALKFGGLCWVVALISVVLPLVHFVLVPGFLIAGPVVAYILYGQESVVLGGQGTCPYCSAALPIVRTAFRFPISDLCAQCQSRLVIESSSNTSQVPSPTPQ
jgi:hypothetical protein